MAIFVLPTMNHIRSSMMLYGYCTSTITAKTPDKYVMDLLVLILYTGKGRRAHTTSELNLLASLPHISTCATHPATVVYIEHVN